MSTTEPIEPPFGTVAGRTYSLWPQIVARKGDYIGGTLEDTSESPSAKTEIVDITFTKEDGQAFFRVTGKDFSCGLDVQYGGVDPNVPEGHVGFVGFVLPGFGLSFNISKP